MSEMEAHKGKLVPMVLSGVTLEERCKSACEKLGFEPTGAHETWEEALGDRGYRKIYIRDRVIYEIHNEELDACGFSFADENKDGSIDYFIMYYNGGASFDEVIDGALEDTDND